MSRTSISEFTLFSLPECQRTPCLKQAPYLKISGSNEIRTHNRLVRKRTLNHLAKLAWANFKCIPVIFQHSSLTSYIPLVKDQSSFYEICSPTICINIKAFNQVNRKQLNILKTFLEYLENYVVAYWGWFSHKSCLKNYAPMVSCS